MIYLTIAIFALAAVMGIIIAVAILGKKPETPKAVVYIRAQELFLFWKSALPANDRPGDAPDISLA